MATTLFQIANRHIAECGQPSPLPADFETGPYYRAYFENAYGEQWIFWFNRETQELCLLGGDLGWDVRHKIVAVTMETLTTVLTGSKGRQEFGNILPQCLLAGQHAIAQILGSKPLPLLFVLTMGNRFVTLNGPEHLWLQACVQATRVELEPLQPRLFRDMVIALRDRADDADDSDDPTK